VVRRASEVIAAALRREVEWIEFKPGAEDKGEAVHTKRGKTVMTIPVDDYARAVRRVKIMANIDPFARESRQGRIEIRWEGKHFTAHVRTHPTAAGERLSLCLQPTKGVEVSEGEPQA
jgi:type II secretory ATPase GspE/PulE/Tfp pilus assembly ATPase PilB-like protein